ncbi:hypothetical protein FISHEDRAFT_62515 [Fistulina hepatica ATCC 64428]|nr:hypothetical protein FISHEDRAFT_62515 [Fistulina hepatica ATCC 64428]
MLLSDTFLPLLGTVGTSILEVFILCLAGYILARHGILDKSTQKQLNRLNVSLFTPSLLFSKVAFFLSPAKLRELWIIPIFFVVTTTVSMSVAFLLGWAISLKRSQRNFAMAAAMFMNSNSLPIALMQSLVVTVPGLKWPGHDDSEDAMLGRSLTYLVLYSSLGMVLRLGKQTTLQLRWSYGVKLLEQADEETVPADEERGSLLSDSEGNGTEFNDDEDHSCLIVVDAPSPTAATHENRTFPVQPQSGRLAHPSHPRWPTTYYNSFPNSPNASRVSLADNSISRTSTIYSSEVEGDEDEDELLLGIPQHGRHRRLPAGSRRTHAIGRRIGRAWITFKNFMTMPLWAALLSIIVACVQPLQHAMQNHLTPLKGALASAGNCSIPLTLVVLGAYFYKPPEADKRNMPASPTVRSSILSPSASSLFRNVKGMLYRSRLREHSSTRDSAACPGEAKTVIVAILSRMVITPLLLIPFMALSTKLNLQAVFDDPIFVVTNVLLVSSPPALTLAQITQAASGDAFERLISRTIFWSYCVVTPPATIIYVVVGMMLSRM